MTSMTSGKGTFNRAMGMRAAALVMMLAMVAGCGSGDTAATVSTAPPAAVSSVVGPAGGTVTGPDGVQVVIPAGALSADTTIGIARNPAGAPRPLQEGNAPAGPTLRIHATRRGFQHPGHHPHADSARRSVL